MFSARAPGSSAMTFFGVLPELLAPFAVGSGLVILGIIFLLGRRSSQDALDWCARQEAFLHPPAGGRAEDPPEDVTPNPVRERIDLLQRMQHTALAQGDIGSFLLRRQDVPGQDAAAHFANVLVSAALLATVMGLVFTLYELSTALRSTAQAPPPPPTLSAPAPAGT